MNDVLGMTGIVLAACAGYFALVFLTRLGRRLGDVADPAGGAAVVLAVGGCVAFGLGLTLDHRNTQAARPPAPTMPAFKADTAPAVIEAEMKAYQLRQTQYVEDKAKFEATPQPPPGLPSGPFIVGGIGAILAGAITAIYRYSDN